MRLAALACLLATPALAEAPLVVTDIPPVHALVAQVMGDLGTPVLLLQPGADEHDFQLRPSQMQSIADAGLIVWIGPELTPWLARASQSVTVPILPLLTARSTVTQDYAKAYSEEHGEKEHAEEEHEKEGHEAHSGTDPHAWLDPGNAALWLPLISAELAKIDPDNAATYAANAAEAAKEIAALDAELAALLAPVATKPFVTYHNAYGYFAAHYALAFDGAIADGEAAEPGAAHLVELRKLLVSQNILCVFPEAQHDPALAAQLLEGTSAKLGPALDPVGSTLPEGPGSYAVLMRGLATSIAGCLQG